jgi:hypothetical protein
MKKKILIGSIIAICILIGVSFTSVVGYRSIDSDVNASPLFNIRSSRAIDEESEDLTSDYVGKNNDIIIAFPDSDNRNTQYKIRKAIAIINRMDVVQLLLLGNVITQRFGRELNEIELDGYELLQFVKNNPQLVNNFGSEKEILKLTYDGWEPGCILTGILDLLFTWLIMLWLVILIILVGYLPSVGSTSCTC